MDSHKLAVKFFADHPPQFAHDAFIPVFHSWIQQHALRDHLLIDVADYAHVPEGPGTVLVSHQANISMDLEEHRLGLLYLRKQPIEGADTFAKRIRAVFATALEACAKLEEEVSLRGKLRFRTDEISFRIYDRLNAPNESSTFEAIRADLQKFITDLYAGAYVKFEQHGNREELFEVRIKAPNSESIATLRQRLA